MLIKISKIKDSKCHRVGFVIDFDNWLGGINYFKNLFEAINSLEKRNIELVVLCGKKADKNIIDTFSKFVIVKSSLFDRFSFKWYVSRICNLLFNNENFLLRQLLLSNEIEVLSHILAPVYYPGKHNRFSSIAWIPDFQHKYLPEFNSPSECSTRYNHYNFLLSNCSHVVVSSNSAKKDALKYYKADPKKLRVLQFVADAKPNEVHSIAELQAKYNFSGNFLFLPNQYWAHKNHGIVIDAIHVLKKQGKRLLVISTGITNDHRNPGYFESLQSRVKELGISDQYLILGSLPYRYIQSFLVHSVAIINPSKFEGWSTTVEEAKTLGKMLILSKIDVHIEQNPARCIYFDNTNEVELAEVMWNVWDSFDPDVENMEMEKTSTLLPNRMRQYGELYEKIVLGVLER